MAQTTVELGRLMRTNFKLFDFDYPFDDPDFKTQLENDLIEYFYDYEIGFETPDMFKRKFKAKWRRIIPHYNNLYNTTLLSYNPLTNYSVSEALQQLSETSSSTDSSTDQTGTRTGHSESDGMTSDYPQQPLAGGEYASGGVNTESTSTDTDESQTVSNSKGSSLGSTEYSKTIEGITGTTYPDLIAKHRDALLRINEMIINEMKTCFILVF